MPTLRPAVILIAIFVIALLANCTPSATPARDNAAARNASVTPSQTPTLTPSSVPTLTPSATATVTASPTATLTPSPTNTNTPTPTFTPSPTLEALAAARATYHAFQTETAVALPPTTTPDASATIEAELERLFSIEATATAAIWVPTVIAPETIDIAIEETASEPNARQPIVNVNSTSFELTRAYRRSALGGLRPSADSSHFLIVEGIFSNRNGGRIGIFLQDFELALLNLNMGEDDRLETFVLENAALDTTIGGLISAEVLNQKTILPDLNAMRRMSNIDSRYADFVYPRSNTEGRVLGDGNVVSVDAGQAIPLVLVYPIPQDMGPLQLRYGVNNANPRPTLDLWLLPHAANEYQIIVSDLLAENFPFRIDFIGLPRELPEELIDSQIVELDNCNGTANIARTLELTESTTVELARSREGSLGLTLDFPLGETIGAMVQASISYRVELTRSMTRGSAFTGTINARPGTMPRYLVQWYLATVEVDARMNISGQDVFFPVVLRDRIRTDIRSLAPADCQIRE